MRYTLFRARPRPPAPVIIATSKRFNFDLISMGLHGRGGHGTCNVSVLVQRALGKRVVNRVSRAIPMALPRMMLARMTSEDSQSDFRYATLIRTSTRFAELIKTSTSGPRCMKAAWIGLSNQAGPR